MKSKKFCCLILFTFLLNVGVFAVATRSGDQDIKGIDVKNIVSKTFKFSFTSPEQIARLSIKADLTQGRTTWTFDRMGGGAFNRGSRLSNKGCTNF